MSDTSSGTRGGVGFLGLLGLLFIGLKLAGFIDWSWWYVTLPLWGPRAFALALLLAAAAFAGCVAVFTWFMDRRMFK